MEKKEMFERYEAPEMDSISFIPRNTIMEPTGGSSSENPCGQDACPSYEGD